MVHLRIPYKYLLAATVKYATKGLPEDLPIFSMPFI